MSAADARFSPIQPSDVEPGDLLEHGGGYEVRVTAVGQDGILGRRRDSDAEPWGEECYFRLKDGAYGLWRILAPWSEPGTIKEQGRG
jgi:hypothetical protein